MRRSLTIRTILLFLLIIMIRGTLTFQIIMFPKLKIKKSLSSLLLFNGSSHHHNNNNIGKLKRSTYHNYCNSQIITTTATTTTNIRKQSVMLFSTTLQEEEEEGRNDDKNNDHSKKSTTRKTKNSVPTTTTTKIAVIGGGLAGLSTVFHLLQKSSSLSLDITILDKSSVGTAGASSVAGGFLHPLSPKGKLVHLGLEGLQSTNKLLNHALQFEKNTILRNEIYRIAITSDNVKDLKRTSTTLSNLTTWIEPNNLPWLVENNNEIDNNNNNNSSSSRCTVNSIDDDDDDTTTTSTTSTTSTTVLGALKLHSGCKVMHLPSYLKGLWSACCSYSSSLTAVRWLVENDCTLPNYDWKQRLEEFDIVVFAAGSGLFQQTGGVLPYNNNKNENNNNNNSNNNNNDNKLPIHLVHGQSIRLEIDNNNNNIHNNNSNNNNNNKQHNFAMLCGKYISPLPEKDKVLIGATHEFQIDPWNNDKVINELKERSYPFASNIWDNGTIEQITYGTRVQSNRGKFGRMPIIGKYETTIHHNAWIFTGLSSRGLLYHGLFGDMLTNMMMKQLRCDDDDVENNKHYYVNDNDTTTTTSTSMDMMKSDELMQLVDWWKKKK